MDWSIRDPKQNCTKPMTSLIGSLPQYALFLRVHCHLLSRLRVRLTMPLCSSFPVRSCLPIPALSRAALPLTSAYPQFLKFHAQFFAACIVRWFGTTASPRPFVRCERCQFLMSAPRPAVSDLSLKSPKVVTIEWHHNEQCTYVLDTLTSL